jgi:hypothetical protein
MTLKEKLSNLKRLEEKTETEWESYKKNWVAAVAKLEETIMSEWLGDYEENKLMEFMLVPVKRLEPYIGEYTIYSLEITLVNNKTLLLEPVAGITSEYFGKLEFSMLGSVDKNINILRKITDENNDEWFIATSYNTQEHRKLTKDEMEKIINLWLP